MKPQSLKWLLLLSVIATGCEKAAQIPVAEVTSQTQNSNPFTSEQPTPVGNTTPPNGGNTNPNTPNNTPTAPVLTPSTPNQATPVVPAPNPALQVPVPSVPAPNPAPPIVPPVQTNPFVQQTEGQTAHNLDNPTNTVRQYLAYIPKGYNAQPNTKWPIVVFLHGSSELGNDVSKIFWTYFAWKTMDKKYPYILITPQLLSGNGEWSAADLDKMLNEILPKYNADASRIILTGYSLGAHGVWDWAEYNPNRFAGIVPVAGWGNVNKANSLKNVPVWAFHGDADNSVNVSGSVNMINAIKNSGGTKTNLTIYPGRGHDIHSTTYDNPDVISWMLNQKK